MLTPVFEGPFDLLLHLILKEQVDLYEVSLVRIVDAYLVEIERMQSLDLEVATEFLLIAATLVELKARRLLPGRDDVDLDDDLALWEERDLLLARLLECKTFKDVGHVLAALNEAAARSYPRSVAMEDRFVGLQRDLLEGVTAEDLRAAYLRAAQPRPTPKVETGHIHSPRTTVADAVAELADELMRCGRLTFRELTASLVDRVEVIVRFLAMLELCKQGLADIDQPTTFGEIEITWTGTELDGMRVLAGVDDYEG